jgi:hypothetical protein
MHGTRVDFAEGFVLFQTASARVDFVEGFVLFQTASANLAHNAIEHFVR